MTCKLLLALAILLAIPIITVYADELSRDEKIERIGNEAKRVYDQKEAETNPEKRMELEKKFHDLVFQMNELGIPTQQQADENPEYWILRSHYAKEAEKARQNSLTNALY